MPIWTPFSRLSTSSKGVSIAVPALALFMMLASAATAQFTYTAHNARSGAMGGCFVMSDPQISIGYRQAFLADGMADKNVDIMATVGKHSWIAASYQHHGNITYHEQQFGAAYGMQLSEAWTLAAAARYLHLGTDDAWYQSRQWLAADVMLWNSLTDALTLGLLFGSRQWDEARPWRAHLQMVYMPFTGWTTVVEAESEERMRLRCGAEYLYQNVLAFRAGMATAPLILTFGAGVRRGQWIVDLAVEVHRWLGLTPQLSVSMCL